MKNLTRSRPIRVAAVLLCAVLVVLTFAEAVLITELYDRDFYSGLSEEKVKNDVIDVYAYKYAWCICELIDNTDDVYLNLDDYADRVEVFFEIKGENFSYSNLNSDDVKIAYTFEFVCVVDRSFGYSHESKEYTVTVHIPRSRDYKDTIWYVDRYFHFVYSQRYTLIGLCALSAILAIALYVFAVTSAGKRKGKSEPYKSFFDSFPLDVILVAEIVFAWCGISLCESMWSDTSTAVVACLCIFLGAVTVTLISMTVSVRIKLDLLWKNNLSVRIVCAIWHFCVKAFGVLPIVWKALLAVCVVAVADVFASAIAYSGFVLPYFVLWLAIAVGVCYAAYNMLRLQRGAKRLASGELDAKIETSGLVGDFKSHAEDLNSIGYGMSVAVEEKMKGERFKTELITNVSHDIKTPVTSIINYVDLLGKCNLDDDNAAAYLDVLRRQSEKLKKLVEDIVEASKASSGVINVDFKQCDLSILLSQVAGEYDERFDSAGLNLVCRVPETPLPVLADGRLVFRIFDNLLGNALKYSLSGTRVYLTLSESDGYAFASVTNVSREELPVDGSDLSERFVRGDASRHTEGSGLGLSIAKSLAEVQNAALIIKTDGDFFKATFRIRTVETDKIC